MRNFMIVVVGLAIVGGVMATAQLSSGQSPARQPTTNVWVYKVVLVKDLVGDVRNLDAIATGLEKGLNDAGGKGWELCHEINAAVVFKRQK